MNLFVAAMILFAVSCGSDDEQSKITAYEVRQLGSYTEPSDIIIDPIVGAIGCKKSIIALREFSSGADCQKFLEGFEAKKEQAEYLCTKNISCY